MAKWYHISDTWKGEQLVVNPRACTRKDDETDDMTPCICVAPTIGQCVVALGFWMDYSEFRIYGTDGDPVPTEWVFDYRWTQEHRFYESKTFLHVKTLTYEGLVDMNLPNAVTWHETRKLTQKKFGLVSEEIISKVNSSLLLTGVS